MSRLSPIFESLRRENRTGLVAYLTAGDPTLAESRDIVRAVARGGADVIEIGVPFSDPIADGPAIQRASERALAAGANLTTSLEMVAALRSEIHAGLVLFSYVNPVIRLGVDRFVAQAAEAGVDGVLLLDLPIEESASMREALDPRGLDQIFLLSPTTTDDRLREAARLGRGFLYAISRLGVTGARESVADTARPLVERIRRASDLPVALGFGVSRAEHVRDIGTFADAAVVGSALVEVIARAAAAGQPPAPEAERFVRSLRST